MAQKCECPHRSVNHNAGECSNKAHWIAEDETRRSYYLCPECITSSYFNVKPIGRDEPTDATRLALTKVETELVAAYKLLWGGGISYSEFILWILTHIPAPCDDPDIDEIFSPLYNGARATFHLQNREEQKEG